MPYRTVPFVNGSFYHLFNRGLEKRTIFNNKRDHSRFIQTLFYYQIKNPKPKFSTFQVSKMFPIDETKRIVDIVCYCLMPNHFHLLVKQLEDGGISEFMRKSLHSYTKYRNLKYKRQGPVFQGIFKAVAVESDDQLIHLSRYIHLNPLVSSLVENLELYPWSSYISYVNKDTAPINKKDILDFFKSSTAYKNFILDQKDYGRTLELLKHTNTGIDD